MSSADFLKIFGFVFLLGAVSCGLPVFEVLDEPSKVSYTDNTVGFTTPGDSLIDGYLIYYKIYPYQDSLVTSEMKLFDPDYYESARGEELPTGDDLPDELGFRKMGFVGSNSIAIPQISYGEGGDVLQIDFSDSTDQALASSDPMLVLNGSDVTAVFGVPARNVLYSDNAVSSAYANDNSFKRFVKNYEFSSTADSDIRSAISRSGGSLSSVEIAFVAISYGISDTDLTALQSIPVHIGTVTQTNFADNALDAPITD